MIIIFEYLCRYKSTRKNESNNAVYKMYQVLTSCPNLFVFVIIWLYIIPYNLLY